MLRKKGETEKPFIINATKSALFLIMRHLNYIRFLEKRASAFVYKNLHLGIDVRNFIFRSESSIMKRYDN